MANVTPILKDASADATLASNYRPISLTAILCKVMERILLQRMWSVVDDKISIFQAGFRKQQSTLHNLYRIISSIHNAINARGSYLPVAFLDLKAAFDKVWIPGLLYKAAKIGITGKVWLWLKSFLLGRQIRVVHNSLESEW